MDRDDPDGCAAPYVSHEGNLEPCPWISHFDRSLKYASLREALQSGILMAMSDSDDVVHKKNVAYLLREPQEWITAYVANEKKSQT